METRKCQNCKKAFKLNQDEISFLREKDLNIPDECHFCIWKHLMSFWTFGKFRKAQSALSGKSIITTFSESVPFPLYSRDEWVSDVWDPLSYGQDYNLDLSFFEQFSELYKKVPRPHQSGVKNVDCQWSDDVWNCKNCYLSRSMVECEDSFYLYRVLDTRSSVDATFCFSSEYLYDCTYCFKSSRVMCSFEARECIDSAFLYDFRNCQDCFMCWNLRNKRYCIENKQYTKEEYENKIKEFNINTYDGLQNSKNIFLEHIKNEAVQRAFHNVKVSDVEGNFLEECKSCNECYYIQFSENAKYILRGGYLKDTMFGVGTITENSVMSVMDEKTYDTLCTSHSSACRYSAYLDYCEDCEYCFGCAGLKKKKFCILNKQYTEEQYKKLVLQIKDNMKKSGEWGKFFPKELAYCGYNLSTGMLYFPMSKEEITEKDWRWEENDNNINEGLNENMIPKTISEVPDDFSKKAIICPKTGYRFNIAPGELQFYKRFDIPVPHYHPDFRTVERFRLLTITTPNDYKCHYCKKDIAAYYPYDWSYKNVACDECYKQNIN